jgi:fructose-bisphosphate aldolase class I
LVDVSEGQLLVVLAAPIGEAGISGAIMFKETLYQSAADRTPFVDCLKRQGVLPGIKVDEVNHA